jgi:prepilin-type N-terminal cleavage/methylation domain-containing protein
MKVAVRSCEARAFTLVELMVVIIVIVIVSGVMVAEMRGTLEDALLRTNARKLVEVCDAASNRAIAIHEAQTLRIDTKSGRFVAESRARGADGADGEVIKGELDNRISLTIREPEREEGAEEAEPVEDLSAITFYPDGAADAREFLFRDRAGVELVLRINPATGRVRIIEMAAQ